VACDLSLFFCGDNLNLVGGNPKGFKTARGSGSNAIAVLSDASGENEKVDSSQQSRVGPDCLADRKSENIQSKTRLRVPGMGSFFQRLYIALARRESEKATLTIYQSLKSVGIELLIAQKKHDDTWVEIS